MDLEDTIHYMLKTTWEKNPSKLFLLRQMVYIDLPKKIKKFQAWFDMNFGFPPKYKNFGWRT